MSNYRVNDYALSVASAKKMTKDEEKIYAQMIEWLRTAETSKPETAYRERAAEDLDFYAGRQDAQEVIDELARQRRPTETYNEVKPKVDMLVGMGAQMHMDAVVVPVGAEDEALAEVMNGAIKHFRTKLDLTSFEMDMFEQVVKGGRALAQMYVDSGNPFKPEIKVKLHRGHRFFIDPDFQEYDLSDARYLFVDVWLTEEDIVQFFPEFKGAEVQAFGLGVHASTDYPVFWNEAREKYRIVEGWYRKTEPVFWFANPMTGKPDCVRRGEWKQFVKSIEELNAQIFEGLDPLQDGRPGGREDVLLEEPVPNPGFKEYVHFAIFSGAGLLESGESPYWHETYPFVFCGAYRDDNENSWFGAISMMKDPQRGLNTMRRQLTHLLQTSPKGILMHESGAILNIEEYEKRSADPTYHMELSRDGISRVQFTNQPQISPIYGQLDQTFVQSMKDTSGIQDSLMGVQTSSREPGVTVRMRQETGLAVLFMLFRNFSRTRKLLGKLLMYNIKQYVDEPTMIRIEGSQGAELMQLNTQLNPQVAGYNDISAGEYDLVVEEGVESSTMRMAVAQWLAEFAHNNPGAIPPDIIMEYSNIPFSAKQRVQAHNQMMIQMQQQAQQQELALKVRELDIKEMLARAKIEEVGVKEKAEENRVREARNRPKETVAKPKSKNK